MNMAAFSKLVGAAPRQVRYLVAEGILPPPTGGRTNAQYGDRHLEAYQRYQALARPRDEGGPGLKLSQIKMLPEFANGFRPVLRVDVRPGVLIEINADQVTGLPSTDQLAREIAEALESAARRALTSDKDENDAS